MKRGGGTPSAARTYHILHPRLSGDDTTPLSSPMTALIVFRGQQTPVQERRAGSGNIFGCARRCKERERERNCTNTRFFKIAESNPTSMFLGQQVHVVCTYRQKRRRDSFADGKRRNSRVLLPDRDSNFQRSRGGDSQADSGEGSRYAEPAKPAQAVRFYEQPYNWCILQRAATPAGGAQRAFRVPAV